MKLLRQAILSLSIVALTASMAFAQGGPMGGGTTGTGPGAGPGTTGGTPATPPTTTTTSTGPNKEVDLPIDAPKKPVVVVPDNPPTIEEDKPPTIYNTPIKSENNTVFFVLDVSGSMGWDTGQYTAPDGSTKSGNRLDRAKAELVKAVTSLPENFKFDMIGYDCDLYPWKGSMQPANAANKAAAVGWIMSRQPLGGTATGPGTAAGLRDKTNKLVILLTDGDPNCGAGSGYSSGSHRTMIRAANTQNAVINVYGIGATGSFKAFCQQVAADNGGSYTDVR